MGQTTFIKPKRGRHILAILLGVVIVIAIVVAVVLAVVLTRKAGDNSDQESERHIKPLSIKSQGLVDNKVRVTVQYQAPKEHTTDWLIRYQHADTYRTAGTVQVLEEDNTVFVGDVTVLDFLEVSIVNLRIYSSNELVSVEFNISELSSKGSVGVPVWKNKIIHIDNNVQASVNHNTSIGVTFKIDTNILRMLESEGGDIEEFIDRAVDMFIDALNTSSEPPVVFEVFHGFHETVFSTKIENKTEDLLDLTINISPEYVQFGALFTCTILEPSKTKYIDRIRHGTVVKILSPGTKDVVLRNSLGVYPFDNQTYIFSKRNTLVCFAMGNPRPHVTLYKLGNAGKDHLLVTAEELLKDRYTHMVVYTVETSEPNEGKYICRANSNQAVSETVTEVIFAEIALINVPETGVVEKTTDNITIACQATGIPRPNIELRLFTAGGPDLIKTGLFQVEHSSPDRKTSSVSMTITMPESASIHTVYCVALQADGVLSTSKRIQVFSIDESLWDWDFYIQVYNLANGIATNSVTTST